MDGPDADPGAERRRNLWKAAAGTVAFSILGLVFAPDLAPKREPRGATAGLGADAAPAAGGAPPAAPRALPPTAGAAAPGKAAPEPQSFDCMIGANDTVDVGSPVRGRIARIEVERGDYVEAGQVVARLESGVEEAAVRAAKARAERLVEIESSTTNLALDRKRRARALHLFQRNALSLDRREEVEAKARLAELELEQSRENHRLAKIQHEQAIADLERRIIRSPIAGYVVERMLSPGEVVDEDPMLRIAQVDPLRVEAILPSQWFGRRQRGEAAEVVPEAPLDLPRSAEVTVVDPVLDGASGTFGVRLRLPNPERELPAGLRCRVRFLADQPGPGASPLAAR